MTPDRGFCVTASGVTREQVRPVEANVEQHRAGSREEPALLQEMLRHQPVEVETTPVWMLNVRIVCSSR